MEEGLPGALAQWDGDHSRCVEQQTLARVLTIVMYLFPGDVDLDLYLCLTGRRPAWWMRTPTLQLGHCRAPEPPSPPPLGQV